MARNSNQKNEIREPFGLVNIDYPPPPGDGFVAIALDSNKKYVAKGKIAVAIPPRVLLEIQALDNDNEATRVGGTENSPNAGDFFTESIQSDFGFRKCRVEADLQDVGETPGFQPDDVGERQYIALPNQFTITIPASTVQNGNGCSNCDSFNTTYTLVYDSANPSESSWKGSAPMVCGQNRAALTFVGESSTKCRVTFIIRGNGSIAATWVQPNWGYNLAALSLPFVSSTICLTTSWPTSVTVNS